MIKNRSKQIKKAKVINTGSLFAVFDIDYSYFDVGGVNLANAPQYLNYDLKYLEKYKKSIQKAAKVVFVLPDFVFAAASEQYKTQNDIYYKEFFPWQIESFSFHKFLKVYISLFTQKIKKVLKKGNVETILAPQSDDQKMKDIGNMVEAWKDTFKIESLKSGYLSEEQRNNISQNKAYLDKMIEVVKSVGAECFLVIPPCSKQMNDNFSVECLESFLFNPVTECAEKSDVKVLNYLYDERFSGLEFYRNGFCLNHKGSKLFTTVLLNDIGIEVQ